MTHNDAPIESPTTRYTTELALEELRRTPAPKKSLRVVFFQKVSTKLLQLEDVALAAFTLKLACGYRFYLAIVDSYAKRDELLRECKRRRVFILVVVEMGREKCDVVKTYILFLLHSGSRYTKRMAKSYHRIRPRLSPGACGI